MPNLDSLKDPNTGKIKTPVLIAGVGGIGLFAFLMMSGKGSSGGASSVGQSSPLTPDLTGLQDALKGLAGGSGGGTGTGAGTTGGGSSAGGSTSGGVGGSSSGDGGAYVPPEGYVMDHGYIAPTQGEASSAIGTPSSPTVLPLADVPGSSGNSGGGGGGITSVISSIARSPVVYGGIAVPAEREISSGRPVQGALYETNPVSAAPSAPLATPVSVFNRLFGPVTAPVTKPTSIPVATKVTAPAIAAASKITGTTTKITAPLAVAVSGVSTRGGGGGTYETARGGGGGTYVVAPKPAPAPATKPAPNTRYTTRAI